jgi:hypothetical protein
MASPALTGYLWLVPTAAAVSCDCPPERPRAAAAPLVRQPVHALPLQQQQAVLVVVHLLDSEELARLKRHDVHVEVILRARGQQLAQTEHLAIHGQQRLRLGAAHAQLRAAAGCQRRGCADRLNIPLLIHQHRGAVRGRHADARGGRSVGRGERRAGWRLQLRARALVHASWWRPGGGNASARTRAPPLAGSRRSRRPAARAAPRPPAPARRRPAQTRSCRGGTASAEHPHMCKASTHDDDAPLDAGQRHRGRGVRPCRARAGCSGASTPARHGNTARRAHPC